jgi:RNA polymerase sigma factor (sigma-70 family)
MNAFAAGRAAPERDLVAGPDAQRASFLRLVAEHRGGLDRVSAAYARSRADRDDLVQEIALAIWRALPGFRGECSERTFVYRIAHNQGISFSTRRRARERIAGAEGAKVDDARDPGPDAEAQLQRARQRADLWEAIRALPVGMRAVLVLALEDLAHQEMAEVLGISVNAVAVRLTRARDALRERMTAAATEGGRS